MFVCMPIAAGSPSHAHFGLPPTESVISCLRGNGKTGWPIGSHDQECTLQYDSNKTVHHQSNLDTCTQFVGFKQATPTAFDPCPPAGLLTITSAIYAAPPKGRCNWWTHSLKIKYILVYNIQREATHGFGNSPANIISHGLDLRWWSAVSQVGLDCLCVNRLVTNFVSLPLGAHFEMTKEA
jgi:hypothetical protein